MGDVLEFITTVLSMSWTEFKLFAGGIATLAVGAAVSELWPFDTDKTVVMNTFMVLSMALFGGIYLYRRFWKAL
jgi:hypothetical protein